MNLEMLHGSVFVKPARSTGRLLRRALALLLAVAASGPARAATEVPVSKVKRYTLRAEIVRLPDRQGGDLMLRHEAVDDFTDSGGTVVGMDSMVMPFPVAREVSLGGLAAGDKVEAVMVMDWDQNDFLLERVRKLPGDTVLHFGKARPAKDAASRSDHPTRKSNDESVRSP